MNSSIELEKYLSNGIENIVRGILKVTVTNPKTSLFITKHMINSKIAREKRKVAQVKGEHIPPFLIASITDKCNLHCKGCYARSNHNCIDICAKDEVQNIMTTDDWEKIFTEASDLGIEFILLAGGEPFVRKDVILQAAKHQNIIFPIFTNGTMIDEAFMKILNKNRNLMPVISIEGSKQTTNHRRGEGIYEKLEKTMDCLYNSGIIFGASITVTKQNMQEVLAEEFAMKLKAKGVKAIIYVEYVPVDKETECIALDNSTRKKMMYELDELRKSIPQMIFIAFPGDEKASGGCLAAGRGFFHINAHGGAEPCPFSPYSDINVKDTSIKEALNSPLFNKLISSENLNNEHIGGCVLFEQKEKVEKMLGE